MKNVWNILQNLTPTEVTDQETDRNKLAKAVIWNNEDICVDGKTAFHRTLFNSGIVLLAVDPISLCHFRYLC